MTFNQTNNNLGDVINSITGGPVTMLISIPQSTTEDRIRTEEAVVRNKLKKVKGFLERFNPTKSHTEEIDVAIKRLMDLASKLIVENTK